MKTRSSDASQDLKSDMPVKDNIQIKQEDGESDNNHERLEKDDSFTSKGGSLWGRELRNRFVFSSNEHMRRTRGCSLHSRYPKQGISSRKHIRSCRLPVSLDERGRVYDDDEMIEDSDDIGIFEDDDDDIFSPRKARESCRRSERRRVRRTHVHQRSLRSSAATESSSHCIDHGSRVLHPRRMEEEDDEEEDEEEEGDRHALNGHSSSVEKHPDDSHEGEGVRRSTRQRKLLYDNFNTSWILGTQTLRGYPMFMMDKDSEKVLQEDQSVEQEGGDEHKEACKKRRTMSELEQPVDDVSKDRASVPRSSYSYEDMYTRVKRPRRAAQNVLYDQKKSKSRSRNTVSEEDATETQSTSSDESFECDTARGRRRGKYHLRKTKPTVDRFQASADPPRPSRILRSVLCNSVRRRRHHPTCDDSSTSSDEERFDRKKTSVNRSVKIDRKRCMPLNLYPDDMPKGNQDGKQTLADTDPMSLDTSIGFRHVGGLESHIRCLQEMVIFPMLYREIFEKYSVKPPKGVLFHGPPGTGKTLIARALANECSQGDRKVSFFMRKGADCLSKWVGESERQLRLLFEQAYQMRPSIIFFDEIDGLAPVRSSKQDQIHASIVSTLLALMDGLDDRGEIIVIGATNRIDAIDPALRRPGRFDRELFFPLPAKKERQEILRIHVSKWAQPPSVGLLNNLAEQAVGYCGSDLRALCSEAVIQGLRRKYPQIYKSSQKLLLDPEAVMVEKVDFQRAQCNIIPAAHRVSPTPARKLSILIEPLLKSIFEKGVNMLKETFPYVMTTSRQSIGRLVHRPHLLLVGENSLQGQTTHLGPALLHKMEHIPVHTLDFGTLYEVSGRSPEETCVQIFQEARRNTPSIIYVPGIDQLWTLTDSTLHAVFISNLRRMDPTIPILLLATSDSRYQELSDDLQTLFSEFRGEVLTMHNPQPHEREMFFRPLLLVETARIPRIQKKHEALPELPLAPPPEPPKLSEEELKKVYDKEERALRELRIFLREICSKLARNRQFFMFSKPVDVMEVPDYLTIIKQPMDLETMMTKIDLHRYACAKEFLEDVDLLVRNALEYNPDREPADKLIRHRACSLRDTAYALIKAEMDSDFEDQCQNIAKARSKRAESPSRFAPDFVHTKPSSLKATEPVEAEGTAAGCSQDIKEGIQLLPESGGESHSGNRTVVKTLLNSKTPNTEPRLPKRRCSAWARGILTKCRNSKSLNRPSTGGSSPGCSPRNALELKSNKQNGENIPDVWLNGTQAKLGVLNSSVHSLPKEGDMVGAEDDAMELGDDTASICDIASQDCCDLPQSFEGESSSNTVESETDNRKEVVISVEKLHKLMEKTVQLTNGCPVESLIELYMQYRKCVTHFSRLWDRTSLPQELDKELERFQRHCANLNNSTAS
ncbi:hypothetical protein R5R35_006699 [Gryllus longicercus]|uniref:Bromo domain-containing protein n=1 Tax=Gryllus longicercus TaxID=2509291 RepID=A0AAN9ZED7_9ORTH